jgi:acyl-coenzyme A thioesterase PaaI-like protein
MAVVAPLIAMKEKGDFSDLHKVVPYAGFLGLSLDQQGSEFITTMHYSDDLIGNTRLPALHGGTISAVLEMASLFQVACELEPDIMPKIVTITVDYMRSGAPRDTYATASMTRVGRRVANLRASAWQEDRGTLIATANVNFLLA